MLVTRTIIYSICTSISKLGNIHIEIYIDYVNFILLIKQKKIEAEIIYMNKIKRFIELQVQVVAVPDRH